MQIDRSAQLRVHLLDMGLEKYGDCILCQFGQTNVLIDGGHPRDISGRNGYRSIPDQLEEILGHAPPFKISLLIVTHCHSDHIGCLPEMISQGMLDIDWALVADENLGYGHSANDAGPLDAASVSPTVQRVVAALREESRDDMSRDELEQFLSDAANLETRYRAMVATLERNLGRQFIRYQGQSLTALERVFGNIGLKILGPSQDHLLLCADAIDRFTRDAIDAVRELTVGEDQDDAAATDDVGLYRALAGSPLSDASDRPGKGAALNDQSIVLQVEAAGGKVLLAGDMQFAKAEVADLDDEMTALRQAITREATRGAYDFVKLSHHASYNGFDEDVFGDTPGTKMFGMTGGIRDAGHPDPGVLALLRRLRRNDNSISWARTDRNGLITVTFGNNAGFEVSRGRLNAATPNRVDAVEPVVATLVPAAGVSGAVAVGISSAQAASIAQPEQPRVEPSSDYPRMSASFPYLGTHVTFSVTLEPPSPGSDRPKPPGTQGPINNNARLAGGRNLPPLLFVTSRAALRRNLGQQEADAILDLISNAGQQLVDTLPEGAADPTQVLPLIRPQMKGARGVVILGGYDVVPAHRLDALDARLRAAVQNRGGDPEDNYLVWSDAIYGDTDGDGMSELPVSRIPDAKTPELLRRALRAGNPRGQTVGGVRNMNRPYVGSIYSSLPGAATTNLLVSEKVVTRDPRFGNGVLSAGAVYLLLHGDHVDSSRFWGEDVNRSALVAMDVHDVPPISNGVVFCGACWGALTVTQRASDLVGSQLPSPRSVGSSMALSFLNQGASAFVGCTGSHYSPDGSDTSYYGAPMHSAFWRLYHAGMPPAEALFQAKTEYLNGIPHRRTRDPVDTARELKILRQFTCLGLGW